MGYKSYSNILAQVQQKVLWKIPEKAFITKKCSQRKASHILKNNVFELVDDKNNGRLFSNYETFFMD